MYASQDPNIPNMVKHRWHVWPSPMWRQCRDNSRVSVAWPHWAIALWAPTPGRVSPLHTGKTINSSWIIHIAYRSFCHYQCQSEYRILCSDELSIIYYYVWHIFFMYRGGAGRGGLSCFSRLTRVSSVQARGGVSPRAGNLGYCLGAVRCRAVTWDRAARFNWRSGRTCYCSLELQTNLRKDFAITEKAPTCAFSWFENLC